MYLQGKDNVFDLVWTATNVDGEERVLTYGDVYHQNEVEQSTYNFEQSNAPKLAERLQRFRRQLLGDDFDKERLHAASRFN